MISFPNAKINIGLSIIEKRPDGFHNLESCFYPIGWSDILEVLPADKVSFKSTGIAIPGDANSNLCLKAYNLLKNDFDIPPVYIHLHKVVPIGAGLGGGSADCAFTIKAINQLFDLKLNFERMETYAQQLGSDCAFFIQNRPRFCTGKGDEFSEIEINLAGKFIVLVNPNIHISTAEAYAGITPKTPKFDLKTALAKPISDWKDTVINDFEESLFPKYSAIEQIKNTLYQQGALYASMTGSGSTVFGIFENEVDLKGLWSSQYSIWRGFL